MVSTLECNFISYRPKQATDCLVSLPAQGAIVGAWLGAWPMPLDWEMPWQVIAPWHSFTSLSDKQTYYSNLLVCPTTQEATMCNLLNLLSEDVILSFMYVGMANLRYIWSNCWLHSWYDTVHSVCPCNEKSSTCQGWLMMIICKFCWELVLVSQFSDLDYATSASLIFYTNHSSFYFVKSSNVDE